MKTSSTKVVWVILLAASPVRLFGCLVKMKGISLLFFVTPCFSVFLHFVGYSFLNVCVCVYVCVRVFAVAFCSGLIKFRGFGLREREQFNFNL